MNDKVIVIAGSSAGIGAALADTLARRGAKLVLVARRKGPLSDLVSRCGAGSIGLVADMTDREDVKRVVDETIARHGRIDVWINNVGQGITRHPSQLTDEDIDQVMQVNVKSALYGMQEVLPHFKSRNDGHIINISSMLGRIPFAVIRAAYSGAKHFLNALTIAFRAEIQETHPGIQVSIVSPGVVRTDFGLNAIHGGPDSRLFPESQSAGEVAAVIAEVVALRTPDVYTRAGAQARIASYYAAIGVDPQT